MVGISVDAAPRNAAMVDKLLLPFPLLSDPEGVVMQQYDVRDPKAGIAIPAIVVVDVTGTIRYLYKGRDFADRRGDKPMFEALDAASHAEGGPPGETESRVTAAEAERPESERNAVSLEVLSPYYRGVYFATVAINGRLAALGSGYRDGVHDVGRFQEMTQGYSKALQETIDMKEATA